VRNGAELLIIGVEHCWASFSPFLLKPKVIQEVTVPRWDGNIIPGRCKTGGKEVIIPHP